MSQHSPATESPLILVADGDSAVARRLASYLRQRGFQASYTSSGEDVLRLASTGRLGLAIIDVSLQDGSGHQVASRLKAMDPEIRVLMTTADYRPELEIRARQAGVLYYAQKPADYEMLEAVVAKAMARCLAEGGLGS
ncbi:MAG: response regulator [Candidatus Rokubacteria bacterium]|nr:response regulator [Candidatus Rokubacteria bacterium]